MNAFRVDVENITSWQNATYFQDMIEIGCAHDKTVPWTYGQSFYYSLSVITTVGKYRYWYLSILGYLVKSGFITLVVWIFGKFSIYNFGSINAWLTL